MKLIMSLVLVSLATIPACVDSSQTSQTNQTNPTDPTDTSESTSELTATGSGPRTNVTCQHIWECDPICGRYQNGVLVWYPTNVLHNECDDGTDTVILKHACFTEDCY